MLENDNDVLNLEELFNKNRVVDVYVEHLEYNIARPSQSNIRSKGPHMLVYDSENDGEMEDENESQIANIRDVVDDSNLNMAVDDRKGNEGAQIEKMVEGRRIITITLRCLLQIILILLTTILL